MRLFDATMSTLERSLDVRLSRQTVLAGNLANANTPGFTPRDLDFAAAMAAATAPAASSSAGGGAAVVSGAPEQAATRPGDLPIAVAAAPLGAPEQFVTAAPGSSPGLDGNAVDVDRASAALAQNALQYGAAAKAASKKLAILKYAASDGQGG